MDASAGEATSTNTGRRPAGAAAGVVRRCFRAANRVAATSSVALRIAVLVLACQLPATAARADDELDFGLQSHRLSRVELTGNVTFPTDQLKRIMRLQEGSWMRPLRAARYQPHLVETQVRLLRNYYRNRGFHQVVTNVDSITVDGGGGDVLHISVLEGRRTYIRRLTFSGFEPVSEARLRTAVTLREGSPAPADLNAFGADIYTLRELLRDETYLDAAVYPELTLEPLGDDAGFAADLNYRVVIGKSYRIDEIVISGNNLTIDRLVQRELEVAPGDPLRWGKVEDPRRNLLGTSLYRDVNINAIHTDTVAGTANLSLHVIERRPAYYELGVGVGSLERVRLLAAWGHNNLWGTGRRVQVRGRGSWNVEDVVGRQISFDQGQVNYRGEVSYVNPRLRDGRYSLDTTLFLSRETRGESGLNMFGWGANVGTYWRSNRFVTNNVSLGYKVTEPDIHPQAPEDLQERFNEVNPSVSRVRSLNWAMYVDHRNDLFHPTDGIYSVLTAQLAGGLLGGDYHFFKWTAAWHDYRKMPVGTLALRIKVGGTRTYGASLDQGADGVPYDDRFFAGGASTVRGYANNSLGPQVTDEDELNYLNYTSDVLLPDNPARGGNYLLLTNAEWRVPLPVLRKWGLATVFFFEGGNVWAELRDLHLRGFRLTSEPGFPTDSGSTKDWDFRYSLGTGLRFDTPFGPVRIDVGFPLKRVRYLNDDADYKDPSAVWHFSVGYPF
ncbi:MAG: BamA/TamA family outer membrane protein [bacterium]|nr:BamA/TamA family outer membrane protein [bacterium]